MEKKIIDSEVYPIRKIMLFSIPLSTVFVYVVLFLICIFDSRGFNTAMRWLSNCGYMVVFHILAITLPIIAVIILIAFWNFEIIVTDKRVLGKTTFNRKVDLPLDSVSAISTSAFNGISVATSSGRISFLFIKNAEKIRNELNKLIIQRQEQKAKAIAQQTSINQVSNADELRKYKQLLDDGIITAEEFDAKKNQLLGL